MCTVWPSLKGLKTVFCVVNNEVYTSTDDGATWNALHIRQIFPSGIRATLWCSPMIRRRFF